MASKGNIDMDTPTPRRKRRCDTNHIIYCLTAPSGEQYVGVTVKDPGPIKDSLHRRWMKHVYRARSENRAWTLYEAMRTYGADSFQVAALEVVRGKAPAHARERVLTKELGATLNTH